MTNVHFGFAQCRQWPIFLEYYGRYYGKSTDNYNNSKDVFEKTFKQQVIIQSFDKANYDPEGKSKRAKFGKQGIYVE